MDILIIILVIIFSIIVLALIAALFVKKEYSLERQIIINAPRLTVFEFIKLLKNQEKFSKWVMMDPVSRKEYKGIDGTVGFITTWDSDDKRVGKGEQEITGIKNGERLDLEVRFEKPFEGKGIVHMTTESVSNDQTVVRWGMRGRNKYPMNLTNLFVPEMLGKDLQESLENLKRLFEQK